MRNDTKPIDWDSINNHLQELPNAFDHCRIARGQLQEQARELEKTHCTGTEHWRDSNSNSKTPKLYVIHHTNTDCPIHGSPEPGKRIRTYIGSKQRKIQEARDAITKGQRYLTVVAELRQLSQKINRASYTLKRIYWDLGAELPTPPLDDLPEPAPVQ